MKHDELVKGLEDCLKTCRTVGDVGIGMAMTMGLLALRIDDARVTELVGEIAAECALRMPAPADPRAGAVSH